MSEPSFTTIFYDADSLILSFLLLSLLLFPAAFELLIPSSGSDRCR